MASELDEGVPRQFAGHQFAGSPPADELCERCGAEYGAVLETFVLDGIEKAMCPRFGPSGARARAAFLAEQQERDRLAELAHSGGGNAAD